MRPDDESIRRRNPSSHLPARTRGVSKNTMSFALPDDFRRYIDERLQSADYGNTSGYHGGLGDRGRPSPGSYNPARLLHRPQHDTSVADPGHPSPSPDRTHPVAPRPSLQSSNNRKAKRSNGVRPRGIQISPRKGTEGHGMSPNGCPPLTEFGPTVTRDDADRQCSAAHEVLPAPSHGVVILNPKVLTRRQWPDRVDRCSPRAVRLDVRSPQPF